MKYSEQNVLYKFSVSILPLKKQRKKNSESKHHDVKMKSLK